MNYESIVENITIFDLEKPYREVAEVMGIDNFMVLVRSFGGSSLYIPTEKHILRAYLYFQAISEYDGSNTKEIAKKYGISERTVYRLISNEKANNAL